MVNMRLNKDNIVHKKYIILFIKELKKRKVHKYWMSDNLKRKIKKLLVSINYNFYKMVTKWME